MPQLIEFATHHFALIAAFMAVLGALLFTLRQGSDEISPARAVHLLNKENALPVDLRAEKDFKSGHIINAINASAESLGTEGGPLQKHRDRPILLYCETGANCAKPLQALCKAGFGHVYRLQGGLAAWRSDNLPLH
jgi:rhodanese-related sulfurtransferase